MLRVTEQAEGMKKNPAPCSFDASLLIFLNIFVGKLLVSSEFSFLLQAYQC